MSAALAEVDSPPRRRPADREAQQFVTFWIEGEVFGLPLAEVQEIIRMPSLVRVPMAAASLEGIANLRGAVLPITSLRRIFGMEDVPHDDSTRVVVGNRGGLSGFVVDRMASVITTDPNEIEPIESISGTIRTDLLSGIVKREDSTIMLLDPPSLSGRAGEKPPAPSGPSASQGGGGLSVGSLGGLGAGGGQAEREGGSVLQLVSFAVADQEYAFPIEDVQEIVQVPPRIRPVPRSDGHVLGVMTLRRRLLPLVSLRRMFGMKQAPLEENNRIVVVTLRDASGGAPQSVGIVMDAVNEVLRVARSLVEPVPGLLVPPSGQSELQGICRLDGDRLVTILSAERMFPSSLRERLRDRSLVDADADGSDRAADGTAVQQTHEGSMAAQQGDTVETAEPHDAAGHEAGGQEARGGEARGSNGEPDEEQFVVFRLGKEEFGVPISAVQEIVRVPENLTRVPRTPSFIEGVVNLRGVVLPVVEQRRRFGLPELARSDRQRIIVLMVGQVRTGFIVDSVVEVLKVARSTIGPAPILSAAQQLLIDRVANLESQKRMLLLIRPARLLSFEEQGLVAEL